MKVLVTGGVRSGKSRHAEELLSGASKVTYVAPGRPAASCQPTLHTALLDEVHRVAGPHAMHVGHVAVGQVVALV